VYCFICLSSFYHSEADQQSFQFYKSGVFDDPTCGDALDHGVAAVGYGTSDDGKDYFKVRNSWVSLVLVRGNGADMFLIHCA
jgi:hypothetical protein